MGQKNKILAQIFLCVKIDVFFNTQKLVNMAGFALSFTKKFEKM
jgi:hypothetical protein